MPHSKVARPRSTDYTAPRKLNHKAAEGKVVKQLGLHERIFIKLRSSSPRLSLELGGKVGGVTIFMG